jgi:hypothetical protein
MKPVAFPESNATLQKPQGMTDEECVPLPVHRTESGQCISCWRLTWKDVLMIIFRRKVWLWVWSGKTQPPVCIEAESPWKKPGAR